MDDFRRVVSTVEAAKRLADWHLRGGDPDAEATRANLHRDLEVIRHRALQARRRASAEVAAQHRRAQALAAETLRFTEAAAELPAVVSRVLRLALD